MFGKCKLCQSEGDLQLSHIIPSFVFKWLKKAGPIRHAENIDRRVQDGDKEYLLCIACEQRLNAWETQFAKRVFRPINDDQKLTVRYESWLLKFCTSISWRALMHATSKARASHLSSQQAANSDIALETWRRFMLDKIPHPGRHEQHLVPFDMIESSGAFDFPPNINRYLTRHVEIDVAAGARTAFVFSKLGRFGIFGFIDVIDPKGWNGTKIHVRSGTIGPNTYRLPYAVGTYLSDRAAKTWELLKEISPKQKDKINSELVANPERFLNSELFRAMQQDVKMFGSKAFSDDD